MKAIAKSSASKTWKHIVSQHRRRREHKEQQNNQLRESSERPRFSLFLASFRR
ncbi:MAG: hypothetical protein WCD07_05885 [Burkholderiales bacterium]